MTEYTDIPSVNALYYEQEMVEKAIGYLEGGGSLTNFTVANSVNVEHTGIPAMPVSITVAQGVMPTDLQSALLGWLTARQAAILAELAGYGVTATPPARKG